MFLPLSSVQHLVVRWTCPPVSSEELLSSISYLLDVFLITTLFIFRHPDNGFNGALWDIQGLGFVYSPTLRPLAFMLSLARW